MTEYGFDRRHECPACTSRNTEQVYSSPLGEPPVSDYLRDFYAPQGGVEFDYLKGADLILDECLDCGLIYQRLVPNQQLAKLLYEKWIDPSKAFQLYHLNKGIDYYAELAAEIAMVIRFFGRNPNELTCLDFGMGWGDWCKMAQAHGCEAQGVELCRDQIEYAKRFGVGVIDHSDIAHCEFDFINTEQVFEHIADPLRTLKYLCRALKSLGIIKISVPNGWDIKRRLRKMDWTAPKDSYYSLNPVSPLEHVNCFNHHSLLNMARAAGLVQINISPNVNKRLLDLTLKEILRPYYRRLNRLRPVGRAGSTCLFFTHEKRGR